MRNYLHSITDGEGNLQRRGKIRLENGSVARFGCASFFLIETERPNKIGENEETGENGDIIKKRQEEKNKIKSLAREL